MYLPMNMLNTDHKTAKKKKVAMLIGLALESATRISRIAARYPILSATRGAD
jgi:hypothetical protein